MKKGFLGVMVLSILIIATAGCSLTTPSDTAKVTSISTVKPTIAPTSEPTAKPTPTPTPKKDLSASQILEMLKNEKLPVVHSITFDEKNDQNSLLGRPGAYTSKASFEDGRYLDEWNIFSGDKDFDLITFNYTCTIEAFTNEIEMQRRYDYSKAIIDTGGMFTQYIYKSGKSLLRLSHDILPTEAAIYEKAFLEITK